jgi:hypothetical protein
MSLTLIAMTGILVGFLCLVIGFFMEDSRDHSVMQPGKGRMHKAPRKKVVAMRKKAA